jgi:selenide,water dikinase
VSGFGLAGHLGEMLRAGKVAARVGLDALPLLPGVGALLGRGLRSTLHPENARARAALLVAPELAGRAELDALFDPQTSGGLLFGVAPEREAKALAALRRGGDPGAAAIGTVQGGAPEPGRIEVVASGA